MSVRVASYVDTLADWSGGVHRRSRGPRPPRLRFHHVIYTLRDGHLVIRRSMRSATESAFYYLGSFILGAVFLAFALVRLCRLVTIDLVRAWLLRGAILESFDVFAMWWASTSVAERKRTHVGRHRFDEETWRHRWAAYDTQWWPTCESSGNAEELVTLPELSVPAWAWVKAMNAQLTPTPLVLDEATPLFDSVAVG